MTEGTGTSGYLCPGRTRIAYYLDQEERSSQAAGGEVVIDAIVTRLRGRQSRRPRHGASATEGEASK